MFLITSFVLLSVRISAQNTNNPDSSASQEIIMEAVPDNMMIADTHELGYVIWKDSPVVAMLDSLADLKYFGDREFVTDIDELNIHGFADGYVPSYPDSVLAARIYSLNKETTM
ncbi:MAG: hypothetical protein K8R63_09510 [Bacteroidales bacterium]|nr:hypothetical protein [Bacteroidales bacterium]